MDPVIDNEWLTCKNDPVDDTQNVGNIARSWQWRERGINPPHSPSNKTVLENIAEDILVQKPLKIRCCDLPGYPRSTFLMVFSPDGTKVASTHGNHNVYVSELASGKHVRILKGHPRTPWCIAFHPSHTQLIGSGCLGGQVRVWDISSGHPRTPWCIAFHPSHTQLIGSGCLGGQVRVWDISSGGSEVWNVHKETVIASIAFHPREQLLVIATYNELYFWDWSQPAPFTRVSTNNINEKVRYVAFDALGYKLITGISLWASAGTTNASSIHLLPMTAMGGPPTTRRDDPDETPGPSRPPENPGTAQDMIVNSYQNLVQRYDSLVRNYQRLFMVRHRLTNTPPPPNTIDRGTDPMETDMSPSTSGVTQAAGSTVAQHDVSDATPGPSTSRGSGGADSGGEGSSSRLLNLDVLSFDSQPSRPQDSHQEHSIFGSRSSAFQPLTEGRSFRTVDQNERSTRLLPNPFSSRSNRGSFSGDSQNTENSANTSRTSIFTSLRQAVLDRGRNTSRGPNLTQTQNTSVSTEDTSPGTSRRVTIETSTSPRQPSISTNTPQRPTMINSSTQMSPITGPVDAQTINESLDLIRDILRDSGTRLLNLITNMSLSTLASVERSMPRRGARAQSDDSEGATRNRPRGVRIRIMSPRDALRHASALRSELLSSSSDSDSDQSLEVNILRTRNSTFRGGRDSPQTERTNDTAANPQPTERTVFELDNALRNEGRTTTSGESGRINVTLVNDRFRVRTQNESGSEDTASDNREAAAPAERDPLEPDPLQTDPLQTDPLQTDPLQTDPLQTDPFQTDPLQTDPLQDSNPDPAPGTSRDSNPRPSTSRDSFWNTGNTMSSEEAYRKVKGGVNALQKHTVQLTNLWLRGNRITMRELRNMWENLRRRILMLQRDTGRQDGSVPSHYTRSLLERCMMLTDMADNARISARHSRASARSERHAESRDASMSADTNSNETQSDLNSSTDSVENRSSTPSRSPHARSVSGIRSSSLRRRLPSRWRPDDEIRRRARNGIPNRITTRTNRSRRDLARAIEISATRHEIRMRAMQVLSIMFNMMMMCLEERGLSQLIISMLRTLKKALALTCLMLMMNRNQPRQGSTQAPTPQRVEPSIVVRIQNVDDAGPVNVDGPDEPTARQISTPDTNPSSSKSTSSSTTNNDKPPVVQTTPAVERMQEEPVPSTSSGVTASKRWSDRLAVQIAEANRNNSVTARNRREIYLERKRQKALHRTNPAAHPISKRRALPPVTNHRIPALRVFPSKLNLPRISTPRSDPRNDEPIAGPSNAGQNDNFPQDSRDEMLNEFEHRVNLIRLAHLQAVRLRTAARTRFRRLQTIRLYTPSSVREMFALQSNNSDNPPGSMSPIHNGPELGNMRSFASYRPHILTPRAGEGSRTAEEAGPAHFHTVLNNVAMPLMQVNDLPANSTEQQGNQPPLPSRLPRIHEYLQPIILAQNAMVVDDEANGGEGSGSGGGGGSGPPGGGVGGRARRISAGMAGLLDAGIISDTLPAPSHRVQAWDFTTGDTPDIADSTKNVVVQRCRIHNDASIDISKDGRLLVALLPVPRLRNTNHWLGVYSLEWSRLGQCLHTAVLEQSAVSVALSPTARHLAVGLGSRRFTTTPHARNNVFALLYRLDPLESSSRTGLSPIKELEQNWEQGFTSLNCLRWAPQPGQGLVYANNTGQLIIMS
ncbi:hypothetical protein NE865_15040 [Phthorimaea operculella]|nr:hypothetical protein NE865_15040 [Phthorimaea operculella]